MNEHDWENDSGRYMNRCTQCHLLFLGHKHRSVCRVCDISGRMERMVAPVKDALDPVKRNIDLGDE